MLASHSGTRGLLTIGISAEVSVTGQAAASFLIRGSRTWMPGGGELDDGQDGTALSFHTLCAGPLYLMGLLCSRVALVSLFLVFHENLLNLILSFLCSWIPSQDKL